MEQHSRKRTDSACVAYDYRPPWNSHVEPLQSQRARQNPVRPPPWKSCNHPCTPGCTLLEDRIKIMNTYVHISICVYLSIFLKVLFWRRQKKRTKGNNNNIIMITIMIISSRSAELRDRKNQQIKMEQERTQITCAKT